MMKIKKVVPMITGIICSSRRMTYLPIRPSFSPPPQSGDRHPSAASGRGRRGGDAAKSQDSFGPLAWYRRAETHLGQGVRCYFTLIEVRSGVPKGVTLTSLTRSDHANT